MPNPNPIGIFDSGVGGLSVIKEIRRMLPAEDIIYYADSAHCPYGVKKPEEVRRRIKKITDFLISRKAKIIVSACNTASIAGIDFLRQVFTIPIVGMEPAIKPASEITQNGKVGVMATDITINGDRFNSLLTRYANSIDIIKIPCPGLVERVEIGLTKDLETRQLLQSYLDPLISIGVDTVVLGCTHYPFLRTQVEEIMGPSVNVIDTGCAVAKQVTQIITQKGLQAGASKKGKEIFFTSGNPDQVNQVINNLWDNKPLQVNHLEL